MKHFFTFVWCFPVCWLLVGGAAHHVGAVACRLRCRLPCVYTLLYIYKRGGGWLPIGCRCSSGVGGAAHALQLSGVGCADHVGAVVSWSGLVAHLVGVLLLMSGGWLLSWLLFVVSVGCQLVGVLLSSCRAVLGCLVASCRGAGCF